jgi:hypothetical protein
MKISLFTLFLLYVKLFLLYVQSIIWNRGIKLYWNRLWFRKDEFHDSLDMDYEAMLSMNEEQRQGYIKDLIKRREIAHERDSAKM